MKKISLCLLATWVVCQVSGEEGRWLTDFSKAQAQAKSEKKLVLLDFNGSDWCAPCQALRTNVLNSQTFQDFAKENVVLVDVDFPHHKQQTEELKKANDALAEKYKVEGFPTLIVLNAEGKELKKIEDTPSAAKELIADLKKLKKES